MEVDLMSTSLPIGDNTLAFHPANFDVFGNNKKERIKKIIRIKKEYLIKKRKEKKMW